MRRRRAERCLGHADAALLAGLLDDARNAMDEARSLAPDLPGIAEMELRLGTARELPDLLLQTEAVPFPAAPKREEKGGHRHFLAAVLLACASLTLVAAASFGWRAALRPALSGPPDTAFRGDMTLHADPVLNTEVEPPAPQAPDNVEAQPSATSTSGVTEPAPARVATREVPRAFTAVEGSRNERPAPETIRAAPAAAASTTLPTLPTQPQSNAPREDLLPPAKAPAVETVPLSAAALPARGGIPVSAPEPAAPAKPRPAETVPPVVEAQSAIRATLARYEAAYSRLDVAAARAVWPAVDERALAHAFDGLAAQRIALGRCDVSVNGAAAHATCLGSAEWTPKVGGGERRQNRRWAFDLTSAAGAWQIVRAEAK
jgi:hypothetical protein